MARGYRRHDLPLSANLAPQGGKRRPGRPYPPDPKIWFDGVFIKENDLPRSFPAWRMATLGGVFTEFHALRTQPRFFADYYAWLTEAAAIAMLPSLANVTEQAVYEACVGILNKNMLFNDALLRLSIFPTPSPNSFSGETMASSILLEAYNMGRMGFAPRTRGLLVKVLEDCTKALNRRSNVQWLADPAEWISQRILKDNLWGDHLLLNSASRVTNAIGGMIYCLIGNDIITPSLSEGVRFDPIRPYVDEACIAATGKSPVKRPLTLQELENASEAFIASSANGIESVLGVNDSRYPIALSNTICDKLNRIYFPELFL